MIFLADFEILDMFFFLLLKHMRSFHGGEEALLLIFLVFSKSQKSYELEMFVVELEKYRSRQKF